MTPPEMDLQRFEEDRLTRALERAPTVAVPADFAARVMARVPERKVARVPAGWFMRRTHYGRNALLAAATLLCCVLMAAAVVSNGGVGWWLTEWTVLAQLAAIALWWGLARRARGSL
jgi:hypothetical protein